MRERVTFVQPRGAGVDPQTLDVQEAGLLGPLVETVREDRITFTVDELPSDLTRLLLSLDELHIRWTTSAPYTTLEPFASRTSPGLHLSYSPAKASGQYDPAELCAYLTHFGKLDCTSSETFTSLSEPESSTKAISFYYYNQVHDLHKFSLFALRELCPELDTVCHSRMRSLQTASSLDVSWDVSSRKLKATAFWPLDEQSINVPRSSWRRTEVGVLAQDVPPSMQPHEAGVSGLLTVLGESKEPSPTLFSFPARHRVATGTFSAKFLSPAGLHPSLQLSLDSVKQPGGGDEGCQLFAYLTLPNVIFADRYQLGDDLFLASKNLTSLRHTTLPVDLEAPAYTTQVWGSSILLELAQGQGTWPAEVPLHLRYLHPSSSGLVDVDIPYPVVFWACDSTADASFDTNPFDRRQLGYDALFSDKTVFWHVTPQPSQSGPGRLVSEIKVPVLKEDAASWIEMGTGAAVALGFTWVLWVLLRAFRRPAVQVEASAETRKKQ